MLHFIPSQIIQSRGIPSSHNAITLKFQLILNRSNNIHTYQNKRYFLSQFCYQALEKL